MTCHSFSRTLPFDKKGRLNFLFARAEAEEVIADFEHLDLAQSAIRDRIAYRKAARDGLGVAEMKPADPKAVEEVRALFAEVFGDG